MQALSLSRADIRHSALIDAEEPKLADGEVRLALEQFALTANNVTYAATGGALGYWNFFPAEADQRGRLPVWGIAEVIESRAEIDVGERVFGFFPMAETVAMTPGRIRLTAWTDIAGHRRDLPPVYNEYFRLAAIPGHAAEDEALMGLLYPLFATSWVLSDYLVDNDWFAAQQIVIGSASSKTAIGFMAMAREMGAPPLIGLTSSRNVTFVESLGLADQVLTYEQVYEIPDRRSVYVDMSGNTDVRRGVHSRLEKVLGKSIAVGLSHWDKFEQGADLPGPAPEFFFAPAQIKKRRSEWGPGVVEGKVMEAWRKHARASQTWLKIVRHDGLAAGERIYQSLAAGQANPNEGHVVHLTKN
ncbi:MAG: DUF2855 family protein [Pseudomonadota bacterium]